MWKRKNSLINRTISGTMGILMTAMSAFSPLATLPVYANESLIDLEYNGAKSDEVEIYVQSEGMSFEPGSSVELKVTVQNHTDKTLVDGGLSWRDNEDVLENKQFVLPDAYGADENIASGSNVNSPVEINEKGSVTNITLAPGEKFEVVFTAAVDDSLELFSRRTLGFFFGSHHADDYDEIETNTMEFDFTAGLVTLLPVEFEDEDHEVEAGSTGSMTIALALDTSEYAYNVSHENLAPDSETDGESTATDANAEDVKAASDSNGDEKESLEIASGSTEKEVSAVTDFSGDKDEDADTATDSNGDEDDTETATGSNGAEDENEEDDEEDEYLLELEKIFYNITTYNVEFDDVEVVSANLTEGSDGVIANIEYDVDEKTPLGTYFGKIAAKVELDGRTYYATQGFDVTVVDSRKKLSAEQLAEVQRVLDLIAQLPTREEYFAATDKFFFEDGTMDEEGFDAYIHELAKIAIPAFEAYQALNDGQKALIPAADVEKLEFIYGLCEGVTFDIQVADNYIAYSGDELSNLIQKKDDASLYDSVGTNVTKNADGSIRLTTTDTNKDETINECKDPRVWLTVPTEVQTEGYKYVVVTYTRTDSLPKDSDGVYVNDAKMQLFALAAGGSASEANSDYKSIEGSPKYQYKVFDFSAFENPIAEIRFDYIDRFPDKANIGDAQTTHKNVLGFSINLDSIIFCKDKETAERVAVGDRARADDIQTVEDSAITFQLFNYSKYINKAEDVDSEADWRAITPFFTFRGAEGTVKTQVPDDLTDAGSRDNRFDEDGFTINHATVERNLLKLAGSTVGYPVLDLTRDANGNERDLKDKKYDTAWTGYAAARNMSDSDRSLAYLFGGTSDHAVSSYAPTNTILQKDNTGLYHYNSRDNAVDYNIDENVFYLRNYTERNSSTAGSGGNKVDGTAIPYDDFMPFNYSRGLEIGNNTTTGFSYNVDTDDVDYWFGMRMDVDFYQDKNGQFNGEDMVFHFSGDDDVWVFIDDILALDLGGTHGVVTGYINFATGEIVQYLDWNGTTMTSENEGDRYYSTTLYECFQLALEEKFYDTYRTDGMSKEDTKSQFAKEYEELVDDKLDKTFVSAGTDSKGNAAYRFKNYTPHQLSFFYMERGSSVANCSIDFNLPTVPKESLSVSKEVEDSGDFIPDDTVYTFRILKQDGEPYVGVGEEYIVSGEDEPRTVGEGGFFTLEAGQTAQFLNMLSHTSNHGESEYVVEEVLANSEKNGSNINYDYKLYYEEVEIESTDLYDLFTPIDADTGIYKTSKTLSAENSRIVKFTNKVAPGNLALTKQIVRNDNLEDISGEFRFNIAIPVEWAGTYNYKCGETSGSVEFVASGSNAVIEDILLEHNEVYEIFDLPAGIDVTITETTTDGFDVIWTGDISGTGNSVTGKIPCGGETDCSLDVICTNNDIAGDLIIRKQVEYAVTEDNFDFQIVLATESNAGYDYVIRNEKDEVVESGKITFTSNNGTAYSEQPISLTHNQSFEIFGLPIVEVTVTELTTEGYIVKWADGDGYGDNDINVTNDGASAIGTIRTNQPLVFECTNERLSNVTIEKTVTGNLGDRNRNFAFTVVAITKESAGTVTKKTFQFDLAHGENVVIKDVQIGSEVVITEANGDYEVTIDVTDTDSSKDNTVAKSEGGATVTLTDLVDGTRIIFTNKKEATIDTGILLDSAPYLLTLAIALGGMAIYVINKRKKEDDDLE